MNDFFLLIHFTCPHFIVLITKQNHMQASDTYSASMHCHKLILDTCVFSVEVACRRV